MYEKALDGRVAAAGEVRTRLLHFILTHPGLERR